MSIFPAGNGAAFFWKNGVKGGEHGRIDLYDEYRKRDGKEAGFRGTLLGGGAGLLGCGTGFPEIEGKVY